MGYHDCHTPAVDPAQRAREPGLVHAVHARTRPRSRRAGSRRCSTSRRWWPTSPGLPLANASLLDEATAAAEAMTLCRARGQAGPGRLLRRRGLPPADDRGRARRGPSRSGSRSTSGPVDAIDFAASGCSACCCSTRRPTACVRDLAPARRARPRRGGARRGGDRPAGAHAARAAGRDGRRHRARLGAALRRAAGLRRAARGLLRRAATSTSATCRAGSSACRRTPRAGRPTGWRCRPASSTSAATRPRATSAPRRCCSRSWPRCTPSTTGPRACGGSRGASTRSRACCSSGCGGSASTRAAGPFFDTLRVRTDAAAGPRDPRARAGARASTCAPTRTARSASRSTRRRCPARSQALLEAFAGGAVAVHAPRSWPTASRSALPAPHARTSAFLTHPVFNRHHAEHEMLRYLSRLQARDLSLAHSMIPLGSCTMKLNGTSEMIPVTWPELAKLHPFAPADAGRGLPRDVRRPRALAGRDHRLRRGVAAAQLRARRASTRACSRSARTTRAAARPAATCA